MNFNRSSFSNSGQFREFWNAALRYQQVAQLPLWPSYPEQKIKEEIEAGLHFSAFGVDGVLAGYFSLALSDPLIWGEKEKGDAVYIHRMCINPACKGHGFAGSVLTWAQGYVIGSGRKYVRMDTWGDNERLVNYYVACGFQHIGTRRMGAVPELPPHYSNANLAMFENEI